MAFRQPRASAPRDINGLPADNYGPFPFAGSIMCIDEARQHFRLVLEAGLDATGEGQSVHEISHRRRAVTSDQLA